MTKQIEWEATHLGGARWVVRPTGQLGTCGWSPVPWDATFVTARDANAALVKAEAARAKAAARRSRHSNQGAHGEREPSP